MQIKVIGGEIKIIIRDHLKLSETSLKTEKKHP
jgi:hypothetical protein